MKVTVAATTIAGAAMMAIKDDIAWIAIAVIVLSLIIVVVVPAVHSTDPRKREDACQVLRIVLGRRQG